MTLVAAPFHALRDRTLAAVDAVFSEPVRLSFMKDGRLDPDREQVVVNAVLRTSAGKDRSVSGRSSDAQWRGSVNAQPSQLHLDMTRYPDVHLRQGDKVRALARPGEPVFEVSTVDSRNHTRLVADLGAA